MPRPFLIFSQSDYLIQIVDINSHTCWQIVQIQIIWLLQKPTDLDLHCLQRRGISGFSRTRVNINFLQYLIIQVSFTTPWYTKNCWIIEWQTVQTPPPSDAAFCGIWSLSTLFAQAYCIYPKYLHTLSPYLTCPKIWMSILLCIDVHENCYPFMPSGFFYLNSLGQSISSKRGVWLLFIITTVYRNSCTLCKQCRPWSDVVFCGIWSGSTLFANVPFKGCQV